MNIIKTCISKCLSLFCKPLAYILRNEVVQQELWRAGAFRPESHHWCILPNDIEEEVYKIATKQSAKYVLENMSTISGTIDRFFMLKYCVERAPQSGLFLEFGVFNGDTVNLIAEQTTNTVHGFDSFEGLPEDWEACNAGVFSRNGILPEVKDNVTLHTGWFDKSLPKFLANQTADVAFLHVDSDLYSSARTVLYGLRAQIKKGTVIVFDEYFNYPKWQAHEFRAFQEFVEEFGIEYEYIAYCSRGYSVGVIIKKIDN